MKTNNIYLSRWIWMGLLAIAAVVYSPVSRATQVPGESCGLGMPPGSPGFEAAQKREKAEVRKNGFLRVCDSDLQRYKISFKPMAQTNKDLAFRPVDLARTPFSQFKSLGAMAEAVDKTNSRFYRGFQTPDGRRVTLFEHDMSADGSSIWRDPADEPEQIRGKRARLIVLQAGAGNAISSLSWIEGRRYYELWIDANVARSPLRQQLFALASSLPYSIPACPNEIPPQPVVIGRDGMPVYEQPPAVMTEAQMKSYVQESVRPCR